MSIQKIVDYVRQTPGNTNPSVVASMVGAEMNGTLREAKEYTNQKINELETEGRIGKKNIQKTIIMPETIVKNASDGTEFSFPYVEFVEGEEYIVIFEGKTYKTKCFVIGEGDYAVKCIGNQILKTEFEEGPIYQYGRAIRSHGG